MRHIPEKNVLKTMIRIKEFSPAMVTKRDVEFIGSKILPPLPSKVVGTFQNWDEYALLILLLSHLFKKHIKLFDSEGMVDI